ncbi:triose-phosphate isomerase [Candidatus Parcubacteria bacterium]|nr:triose-phosphate isomerase [Candidatus Parcubacteria bacterium]
MAKPILVANWKNHPSSIYEAKEILRGLTRKKLLFKKLFTFIAPPTLYIEAVANGSKSFATLASQDIPTTPKGTYTGEISIDMLKSFGTRLAIVGHSERRALGEMSEVVSKKVLIALKSGISPLICVGEKERDADGEYFEFLRDEIKLALQNVGKSAIASVLIAYEPVWAIGKSAKEALPPQELAQSVLFIRKVLTDLYGRALADKVSILYGGSVEPENAGLLMRESGVRGFLVGHASLKPKSFEQIALSMITK